MSAVAHQPQESGNAQPVTLFEAWTNYQQPKPSLDMTMREVKNGNIRGAIDQGSGIYFVPSSKDFTDDLAAWIVATDWAPNGRTLARGIPLGHVRVHKFVCTIVSKEAARESGLMWGDGRNFGFSTEASAQLKAGALKSASKTARGEWFALEVEVRDWLWRSWNIGAS